MCSNGVSLLIDKLNLHQIAAVDAIGRQWLAALVEQPSADAHAMVGRRRRRQRNARLAARRHLRLGVRPDR